MITMPRINPVKSWEIERAQEDSADVLGLTVRDVDRTARRGTA